jgi:hypothetical protein
MVQAAVEGCVDFSKAEFYDPKWQQHLLLILTGLARSNRRQLRRLVHERYVAIAASRRLTNEQFAEYVQGIDDTYHDIIETYYPQDKELRVQHEKAAVRQDVSRWESKYGKLSDAQTQENLRKYADAMEQLRLKTAAEMQKSAASQLGYMGRELGIDPAARLKKRQDQKARRKKSRNTKEG